MTKQGCKEAIEKAISHFGTQVEMAKQMGVAYQSIQGWRANGSVPAERAVQIELLTEGAVQRQQLRPDLFEKPTQAA